MMILLSINSLIHEQPNDVEMEKAQTKLKVDIEEVVNDIESLRDSFRSV